MTFNRSALPHCLCIFIILLQAGMLAWSGYIHSPTHLEVFHLPAGLSHWELSRYDLYRVNPPLIRMIAAFPVWMMNHERNYSSYSRNPFERAEYAVGLDTMHANGTRFVWLVTVSRWACIPFILLGSIVVYIWTQRLYGNAASLVALLLWAFCPYVLGQGSVITPDAHAASLGIVAAYFFWLWLQKPTWKLTLLAGIFLGIAELSKFTLLLFYPVGMILWLVIRLSAINKSLLLRESTMGITIVVVSIVVLNFGYDFEDTCKTLGNYRFQSLALTGAKSFEDVPTCGGNRFVGTLLEDIPVPLPSNYLMGLDLQKKDSERGVFSYLHGTWQIGGWWYFYLYAMLIKIPLGTWGIVILALIFTLTNKSFRSSWQNEIFLLLPVFVIVGNFSMQHGIGIHSRYIMPLLPFLFIWAGKTGIAFSVSKFGQKFFVSGFLVWSLGSSFYSFPHSISYCNEIVGGSKNAYKHLAKSDSSWGQDLLLLHQWLQLHPEVTDLHLAHCGPFDPRIAGLNFTLPLVGLNGQEHDDELLMETLGPQPGWYAIDVIFLLGSDPLSAADGHGGWVEFSKLPGYDISYFQEFDPIARIGYSIYIYHLTQDDVRNYQKDMSTL